MKKRFRSVKHGNRRQVELNCQIYVVAQGFGTPEHPDIRAFLFRRIANIILTKDYWQELKLLYASASTLVWR